MNKKNNWLLVLVVLALILSILSITLWFFKFSPIDVETSPFVGIIATLIGVMVTFLVAYQIFNTIQFRNEIKEIERKLAHEFDSKLLEIKASTIKQELITSSTFLTYKAYLSNTLGLYQINAFVYQLEAIHKILLSGNTEGIIGMIATLKNYITYLSEPDLYVPVPDRDNIIDNALKEVAKYETKIKEIYGFMEYKSLIDKVLTLYRKRMERSRNGQKLDEIEKKEIYDYKIV